MTNATQPKVAKDNIGKKATILATRYPNHAEVVGSAGAITKINKKQNLYTVKLDSPVKMGSTTVKTWDALPSNISIN